MHSSVWGSGGPTVSPLFAALSDGRVLVNTGEHSVWP